MGSGDWLKTLTGSKKAKGIGKKQKKVCSHRLTYEKYDVAFRCIACNISICFSTDTYFRMIRNFGGPVLILNQGTSTNVKSNGFVWKPNSKKPSIFASATCDSDGNRWVLGRPIEDVAATRIQTTFRAYWARKSLRRLKGIVKLQILTQGDSVKRQAVSTLNHLHTWGKIQDQIKARRLCMVVKGRLRQKKLENQLKLDAKLHDAEAEWSCTAESMHEIIAKIHMREEASVKRERALAYAFTHQWRANSSQDQLMGNSELGKSNWGWSWMERWIAARPWESRIPPTPKSGPAKAKPGKANSSQPSTPTKLQSPKPKGATPKTLLSNGKATTPRTTPPSGKGVGKPRRLSYPPSTKQAAKKFTTAELEAPKNTEEQEPKMVTSN